MDRIDKSLTVSRISIVRDLVIEKIHFMKSWDRIRYPAGSKPGIEFDVRIGWQTWIDNGFLLLYCYYVSRHILIIAPGRCTRRGPFGCKVRDDAVCHRFLRRRTFLARGRVSLSFARFSERIANEFLGSRAWFRVEGSRVSRCQIISR